MAKIDKPDKLNSGI